MTLSRLQLCPNGVGCGAWQDSMGMVQLKGREFAGVQSGTSVQSAWRQMRKPMFALSMFDVKRICDLYGK